MTADQEHRDHHHELRVALAERSLIQHGQEIKLNAYHSAFPRRNQARRWHYQITSQEKTICHLVVGLDLASVYQRTVEFFTACPELICRPLHFWKKENGLGYLCLEHFPGTSLDTLVEQNNCSTERWIELVRQAQTTLEKTRRPSSKVALEQEVAALLEEVKSFPGISEIDNRLLRELAQPAILEKALTEPLTTRWSNGDFCGRNLLVNDQGDMRLIDYEFAAPTHFSNADWHRLTSYSILPKALDEKSILEIQQAKEPWRKIWFWLHHLAQLKDAEPSDALKQHLTDSVSRLFAAIGQNAKDQPTTGKTSLLITLLSTQEDETRVLLNERMNWVRMVEAEQIFIKEKFARLTDEFAERTTWAQSVDAELLRTQKSFIKVSTDFAQQQLLVLELTKLKNACAALAPILNANPGTNERSLLQRCVAVLGERQRDLAAKHTETSAATGAALDARLRAEVAETEVSRLKAVLTDAQLQVDHLLTQTQNLSLQLGTLTEIQGATQNTLLLRDQELACIRAELQAIRRAVARYQQSWLCRLADRISGPTPPAPTTP